MYSKISLLLILSLFTNTAFSNEVFLTEEETKILKSIKHRDKRLDSIELQSKDDPGRYNNMMKMMYNNNGIISIPMSPMADILRVKMCYKSPLMIELGESIKGTISSVATSSTKIVDYKEVKGKRKVLFSLVDQIEKTWENTFWIERSIDKKDYIVKIFAEKCPESKTLNYMSKIILEEKVGMHDENATILSPTDYIAELTKGTTRDNTRNFFKVNKLSSYSDSTWHSLSISIGYKELPKENMLKDGRVYIKSPKISILDFYKLQKVNIKTKLLPESSKLEARASGVPTQRYNVMFNLTKRYIYEMKYIYMLIQYDDYHQLVKIPIKDHFEKSIKDRHYRI